VTTRAVSATLVAVAFAAPLAWLLGARIPATSRRSLSNPPPEAQSFAVEIPELRYLRVRGGGSVHRIRLSVREAREFARHSEVSLLVATYDTKPVLDRAEIAVTGTDCVFRTLRGARFPNNGLLALQRGSGCARVGDVSAAELRLTVQFDTVARAALWADAPIDKDLAAGGIVISDRTASPGTLRPMLRGAYIDVDPSQQLSRVRLLAYMWQVSPSPRWIWIALACSAALAWIGVFLLAGAGGDAATARGAIARAMAGGFCAAAALTVAYAVIVPPFHSADESHHFAGFAEFVRRPEIASQAEEWARLGHFARIQFRPEEHFTPADIGVLGAVWRDGSAPDPSLRGAAVLWLWRAVPPFVRGLPVPRLLLALRLIDGALFAGAVALFFGIVTAAGETRHAALYALPLFLVPTLPFFSMTVSNYGLLTAAYVLVAAGIVLDLRDGRGAAWAGPLIGFGWMVAALTARSAVPLAPFVFAWLLGRLVIGRRDPGWRAALIYWIGVTAFLVAGISLADQGYVRTTVGLGQQKLPGAIVSAALIVLSHPWLLLAGGLAAAAVERAMSRRARSPSPRLLARLRRGAIAAPLVMAGMLALSVVIRYPKLAPVDPGHMPPPGAYVKSVMAAATTMFRVTNVDFLTSWSFWGGFGWLETVPPPAFVSILVSASGLAFSGLVFLLARAGDVRSLVRVGLALIGAALSMAAYAISVVIVTPADLHGRYLIGLYVCMLTIAWSVVPLFVTGVRSRFSNGKSRSDPSARGERWVGPTGAACAACFVAVHVVSLAVILLRYF
jgi:hypothetical protein